MSIGVTSGQLPGEPCDLSATRARELIGRRRLSPVELLESCIARIEMVNPTVNAFVAECRDRARAEAREKTEALLRGDDLPLLHGLPVGIKDLNATEGLVTTWGSPIFENHIPEADDSVVASLRAAGAIVLGKTNTPEFGAGGHTTVNPLHGYTCNPFDLARSCGGSSGGSGAALAARMVPLCSGSDSGGSLRKPATWCGVAAIRPSIGVVPSSGRGQPLTTFGVQGPMARDAEDVALMLGGMLGGRRQDMLSRPDALAGFDIAGGGWVDGDMPRLPAVDLSTLRVSISENYGFAPLAQGLRGVFRDRLGRFSDAFASCENSDPPLDGAIDIFWALRGVAFVASYKKYYEEKRELLGQNIIANVESGLGMTSEDIGRAHAEHARLYRAFEAWFESYDLLITPGQGVSPDPVEQRNVTAVDGIPMENYMQASAITSAITLTGYPAVAVPCGYDHTGAPFGFQIVGPKNRDMFTLAVAATLERLFAGDADLAAPVPDIEKWRE